MHHVNHSAGQSYQHSGRNQFAPASASSAGMSSDRVAPGSSGSSLSGSRGVPVMMRVSPTGVPTYYYYAQHSTSTSSSPVTVPSSTSPRSGAHSPAPGSAPHSPNPSHHRQLGQSNSNPFHYHHHHQLHYVPGSSLQTHYNLQIPAAPALQQSHCFASPPATPSPPRTPPPAHPMVQSHQYASAQASPQRQVTSPQHQQSSRYTARTNVASGTSAVAIDNKIEQAMDLVKSHLMFAVREEVEVLKEKIAELMERINQLEVENSILKAHASSETLAQLSGGGAGGGGQAIPPTASIQMQVQGQQQAS